jgi:hypothetical protein
MTKAHRCLRYYYLRWYEVYQRGMGSRLPPPYYNGTIEVAIESKEADEARSALRKPENRHHP